MFYARARFTQTDNRKQRFDGEEYVLSSGFAPRYSLWEARVADGDSKNRTSLVRLRPAQANGQQSKDCLPSVSLRSKLFAVLAAWHSFMKEAPMTLCIGASCSYFPFASRSCMSDRRSAREYCFILSSMAS